MSTPDKQKLADAAVSLEKQNPTVHSGRTAAERKRIPMSVPMRKLECPDIPGFKTKWFRGTANRLAQAERAGFVHVDPREVELNNLSLGGDAKKDGNTDMGGRVSVIEGSEVSNDGQAVRLYLMKQPMEYHLEDRAILQDRNDGIAAALTTGSIGAGQEGEKVEDTKQRYLDRTRTKIPDFFKKKPGRT